ncbi:hypothetical protein PT974_02440 [Cladobotryum mycophilum]|uniref:NADH-ubiquinone reductase complex 1 MLRQ subunit n=1 Tax=Cladobotryum mycophilum TaxID=491253 RepID=A0ABR0SY58_9HYPO
MRSTAALRMFRPTARMMRPVPKEDQAGHTISQRLRKLKQIPPELFPLAIVVGFALFAAGYSSARKFIVDKNLRLSRQGAAHRAEQEGSHGGSTKAIIGSWISGQSMPNYYFTLSSWSAAAAGGRGGRLNTVYVDTHRAACRMEKNMACLTTHFTCAQCSIIDVIMTLFCSHNTVAMHM